MFSEGKRLASKLSTELANDGATNCDVAWKKEYCTITGRRAEDINCNTELRQPLSFPDLTPYVPYFAGASAAAAIFGQFGT